MVEAPAAERQSEPVAEQQSEPVAERRSEVVELHNRTVPVLMAEIVQPTLRAGGDMRAVLLVLESVACGVLSAAIKLTRSPQAYGLTEEQASGIDEDFVVDLFVCRVQKRMAELRVARPRAQAHDAERGRPAAASLN